MASRVLIIDDEPEFRSTLADILTSDGYEVESSSYLASSIGIGSTGQFDLVTLDLRMPHISGLDVAALIRKLHPGARLLVISGYLNQDVRNRLNEMGITHQLSKPASIKKILGAVAAALSSGNGRADPPPGETASRNPATGT